MVIKEVKGQVRVYNKRKLAGTLRTFCCGVDFRPIDKPGAIFSILLVRMGTPELKKCVEALLSLDIPDKRIHWNFNYETATDNDKLSKYQASLSKI